MDHLHDELAFSEDEGNNFRLAGPRHCRVFVGAVHMRTCLECWIAVMVMYSILPRS